MMINQLDIDFPHSFLSADESAAEATTPWQNKSYFIQSVIRIDCNNNFKKWRVQQNNDKKKHIELFSVCSACYYIKYDATAI